MNNLSLYTLTVLIWGSTWYAITFQLGDVHPILSVSYRFMLASLTLFAYMLIVKKKIHLNLSANQHLFIALQGLFLFCTNYILVYFATSHLTSGLVAILFSTMTLMNILNQALFFKIRVKKQVALGSLIGLLGISLVFWPEIESISINSGIITGITLCLISTYSASLGTMLSTRNSRNNIPVLEANALGMAYGAGFSMIIILIMGIPITFDTSYEYVLSLLYLAILGSSIAFGCFLTLIKNIGADKAAYTTILFPLVALTISTFFEGYIWTPLSILGVSLTLLGNAVAMLNRKSFLPQQKKKSAPTT